MTKKSFKNFQSDFEFGERYKIRKFRPNKFQVFYGKILIDFRFSNFEKIQIPLSTFN